MSFDRAFELVIGVEGGYVNDPRDPGGETIYGITRRDHADLWKHGRPTLEQAKVRYDNAYWRPAHCHELAWPLSFFVFDCAVNQGVGTAAKLLQTAVGVSPDGAIGRRTLAAIEKADHHYLCACFLADRALRYTATNNFEIYGKGWFRRLFRVALESK